ncbi:MAG TPA: MFS transporter [Pseudonocardiaceae bacterium]
MTRGPRAGFAAAFAVREFRALWAAEAQSVVGDQLAKVALSVVVYQRTGSAGLTALSYAVMLLPALVAGPLLSWVADAFPRRAVMVGCALAQAVLVGLMALPGTPVAALFGLIVVVQLVQAPYLAAQAATLPVVLTGEAYQAGQALRQITRQIGTLAGLAFGGMTVVLLGVPGALALDAATFVVAALVIRVWVADRPAPAATGDEDGAPRGSAVRQGIQVIWGDPRLRALTALAWLAGFAVVPEALMVPLALSVGAGPTAVGWLLAIESLAMVIGAYLLVRLVSAHARQRLLGPLAVLTVLPLVGFAAGPGLAAVAALLALAGFFAAYQVTVSATFMELVPDDRRGQAYGIARSCLISVQGLGVLLGGLVAELTGSVGTTIAIAGGLGVLAAVPAALAWRRAIAVPTGKHAPTRMLAHAGAH